MPYSEEQRPLNLCVIILHRRRKTLPWTNECPTTILRECSVTRIWFFSFIYYNLYRSELKIQFGKSTWWLLLWLYLYQKWKKRTSLGSNTRTLHWHKSTDKSTQPPQTSQTHAPCLVSHRMPCKQQTMFCARRRTLHPRSFDCIKMDIMRHPQPWS